MEKGWGLAIRAHLTWFPTIRFRSLRDTVYPGERLSFPGTVGAPFLSHCLDPQGCHCLFRRAAGLWVSGLLRLSGQGLSASLSEGRLGGGAGEPAVAFGGYVSLLSSVNIHQAAN